MGVYIPNMKKPSCCALCLFVSFTLSESYCDLLDKEIGEADMLTACPLIEIDDELIKKLQESAIVIKAVFNRLKKMVNDSDELKTELMGLNPNLTILDEANAIQHTQRVESALNRETCNLAYYGICTDGDCNNCPYEGERRTDERITE